MLVINPVNPRNRKENRQLVSWLNLPYTFHTGCSPKENPFYQAKSWKKPRYLPIKFSTLGALCAFARIIVYPIFSSSRQACKETYFPIFRTWRPLRLCESHRLSDLLLIAPRPEEKYFPISPNLASFVVRLCSPP